jgi:hypothetical protein
MFSLTEIEEPRLMPAVLALSVKSSSSKAAKELEKP